MKISTVKSLFLISLTAFIANYLYFRNFGFYEDDYFYITTNIGNYLGQVIPFIWIRITNWFYGHPLIFISDILTYIGMKSGGLYGLYLISFLILTLNSFLVYLILKKVYSFSEIFAVSGAMMFCLFPANTAKVMLTFSFSLQVGLTFLFISTLLYLSGKRKTSYLVILGSLFLYEPAFMVFWGIPLLKYDRDEEKGKEMLKHIFILLMILIVNLIARYLMEGEKVLYILKDTNRFLSETISSITDGPSSIISSFLRAPFFALKNISLGMLPVAVFSFLIFLFSFYSKKRSADKTDNGSVKENIIAAEDVKTSLSFVKIFFVSIILIVLSYSLPLVYKNSDVTIGKMTIVHTAASFGSSILFASVVMFLINSSGKRKMKVILTGAAAAYLTLLVCYNVLIQKDFVQSWENQKAFWTEVKELCPDIREETLIFVIQNEKDKLPQTKFIQSNSWTDPIILGQIYKYSDDRKTPARVFVFNEDWEEKVFVNNDTLKWNVPVATWDPHTEILRDSNLIILRPGVNNNLVREELPVILKGKTFNLKTNTFTQDEELKEGELKSFLIKEN